MHNNISKARKVKTTYNLKRREYYLAVMTTNGYCLFLFPSWWSTLNHVLRTSNLVAPFDRSPRRSCIRNTHTTFHTPVVETSNVFQRRKRMEGSRHHHIKKVTTKHDPSPQCWCIFIHHMTDYKHEFSVLYRNCNFFKCYIGNSLSSFIDFSIH